MQLIDSRGKVTDAQLQAIKQSILDVVMDIALAVLYNHANNVVQTEINPELIEFAP